MLLSLLLQCRAHLVSLFLYGGLTTEHSELYKILGKVIEQLYNQNLGVEQASDMLTTITVVWDLDSELREWDRELPQELRVLSSTEVSLIFDSIDLTAPVMLSRRFQFILTLRYLNLRLLLHRPILIKQFETTYSPNLNLAEANILSKLGSRSLLTCFRCSMQTIDIVTRITSEPKSATRYLSAWWFTLYYSKSDELLKKYLRRPPSNLISAFNAALVVFGVMVVCHDGVQKISHAPSREACKEGVEKAVKTLARMDPGNKVIQRCHNYLQRLVAVPSKLGEYVGLLIRINVLKKLLGLTVEVVSSSTRQYSGTRQWSRIDARQTRPVAKFDGHLQCSRRSWWPALG